MRQSKLTQGQQTEIAKKKKDIEARKAMKPEYCPKTGEAIVGYIEDTGELVCNTCIFKRQLQKVKYTALVSRDLRGEFNGAFEQYRSGVTAVNGVDADLVKQKAAILVQNFFSQIKEKLR